MEFCCSGILNSLDFSIKEDIISLGIIITDLSELAIKVFSKDLLLNKEVSVFFILSNVLVFNKALVVEILFSFLLSLLKSFKLDIPKHTSSKLSHDNSSHNLVIFSSVNTSFAFICFFFNSSFNKALPVSIDLSFSFL